MAGRDKPKRKNREPRKKGKVLDIAINGVIDNITFSKKDVYAYYKISTMSFDFLDIQQRISTALMTGRALSSLALNSDQELEIQIIATHVPIDIDAWRAQIEVESEGWETSPELSNYLDAQDAFLEREAFTKKTTYIGVKIANRGALDIPNVFEAGMVEAKNYIYDLIDKIASPPGSKISEEEERTMRRREQDFFRVISTGDFKAERATTEEILLMVKRPLYPGMPSPYLLVSDKTRVGPGDIAREVGSHIEKKWNHLKFTQMFEDIELEGYRASLVFEKFPDTFNFPGMPPFLYYSSMLREPFTCYGRFILVPSSKMRKEVEKKRKEHKDEMKNIEAGQDRYDAQITGIPSDAYKSLSDINVLSDILASDASPWIEGKFRIAVEASTLEDLNKKCASIISSYERHQVKLRRTGADQVDALLEQMPGDRMRDKDFVQHANIAFVATSGFNFNSEVGDEIDGV